MDKDDGVIGNIGGSQAVKDVIDKQAENTEQDGEDGGGETIKAQVVDTEQEAEFDNIPALCAFTVIVLADGTFKVLGTSGQLDEDTFVAGAPIKCMRPTSPQDILTGCRAIGDSVFAQLCAVEHHKLSAHIAQQGSKGPPKLVTPLGMPIPPGAGH